MWFLEMESSWTHEQSGWALDLGAPRRVWCFIMIECRGLWRALSMPYNGVKGWLYERWCVGLACGFD